MTDNLPLITVVIATFNSTRLLPMVVGALRKQTYPGDRIEILAVDGGSTDATRELAQSLGCTVIDNPLTEPVHAKFLGFQAARGKYLVYLDHDEEIVNPQAFEQIVATFREFPQVRTIDSSGYINPPGYPLVNEYINEFGEPFSFFMYRQSRGMGFHLPAVRRKARMVAETGYACVFAAGDANRDLFIENLAAGVVTDIEYVKTHRLIERPQDLCHLFFLLNGRGESFAVQEQSAAPLFRRYLVQVPGQDTLEDQEQHLPHGRRGGRRLHGAQSFQPRGLALRKYLFLPYAFSVVLPLADGIWLCCGVGPTKAICAASQASANAEFSDRKP